VLKGKEGAISGNRCGLEWSHLYAIKFVFAGNDIYGPMGVAVRSIAEVLGGESVLGRPVSEMRELDAVVREGLPESALKHVLDAVTAYDDGKGWEEYWNKIAPQSRRGRKDRFSFQVSETIERLAHLYALSFLIFRDPIDTSRFMLEPHPELGDRKPVDVALTEVGGREVEDVIERGLYGLPA